MILHILGILSTHFSFEQEVLFLNPHELGLTILFLVAAH